MKEILLPCGRSALVDDEDFASIDAFKWRAIDAHGITYARTGGWKKPAITMHRQLCGNPKPGFVIDHVNGNGLDNRRENLRIVPQSINRLSSKTSKNNTSGFRGVTEKNGKWVARLGRRINGRLEFVYLGTFTSPEEASKAYHKEVRKLYGEFFTRAI